LLEKRFHQRSFFVLYVSVHRSTTDTYDHYQRINELDWHMQWIHSYQLFYFLVLSYSLSLIFLA